MRNKHPRRKYRQADEAKNEISPVVPTAPVTPKAYVFIKPFNWLGLVTYKAGDKVQGILKANGEVSILSKDEQYMAASVPPEFIKAVEEPTPTDNTTDNPTDNGANTDPAAKTSSVTKKNMLIAAGVGLVILFIWKGSTILKNIKFK